MGNFAPIMLAYALCSRELPRTKSPGTHFIVLCDNQGQIVKLEPAQAPVRLIGSQGSAQPLSQRYYDIDLD